MKLFEASILILSLTLWLVREDKNDYKIPLRMNK
jgi:hypothetical protein